MLGVAVGVGAAEVKGFGVVAASVFGVVAGRYLVGTFMEVVVFDGVGAHFEDVAAEGALVGAVAPVAAELRGGAGAEVVVAFAVGAVVGAGGALVGGGVVEDGIEVAGGVDAGGGFGLEAGEVVA